MNVATTGRQGRRRKVKQGPRIEDIHADAALLGVHRITLWKVIHGKARNPELLKRYKSLRRTVGGLHSRAKTAVGGRVQAASTGNPTIQQSNKETETA